MAFDDGTSGVDERLALLPALRHVPVRQRSVLVLRYLCDLPDAEIATTLGVSEGTVRSQAARGLDALRAHVPRYEPEVIR
jgi:RNA polymerase sigma factor (sigma-70 family)